MSVDIAGNRTLRSQWDETVRFYGTRTFLEYITRQDEWSCYTYGEFDRAVKQCANLFLSLGIAKGELVGIHLHNMPQYLVSWLALAQIGAVSVPINAYYTLDESSYILEKCRIRTLITEQSLLPLYAERRAEFALTHLLLANGTTDLTDIVCIEDELENQPTELRELREVHAGETAVMLFTSGTTRHPKGAVYTHTNVVYGGLLHAAQVLMETGDRFLSSMPCYHMDFQEMAAMPVICTGSTLVMIEHYSARRFWKQVVDYRANFTDTMSIMNRTMLVQPVQPWEKDHAVKQIYFSMGLSDEEKEAFESRFNVQLLNSYGMTETVTAVTCAPLYGDKKWPSVGRPALSYEIKIVDERGNELPAGKQGEICVLGVPGRSIVKGYFEEPEESAKLLDADNWLHSGDIGYLDEDGFLYFVDRSKHLIKRSGENVSSLEVECVLTSHPLIVDTAVIGVPDAMSGETVKAFVQLEPDAALTVDEITGYCATRLAKFKVPAYVEFVDAFPRTATGKIKKQLLS